MSNDLKKKILNNNIFRIFLLLFFCFLVYFFFIFFSFYPKGDPFISRYSKSMLDRNDEILSVFLNKSEQWHIKNSAEISQKLKIATLTFEDRKFYSHIGIDFGAILRSIYINTRYSKRVGGSTITMQTIKLLTGNKRTYFNKLNEMILSLRLETLYSKDEILEMYLNNAPYGGNIVGVGAASLMYFRKSTKNLTWGESALLAVLPNSPGLINVERNSHLLLQKRNKLLDELYKRGYIDDDNLKLAKQERLPSINRDKNLAPHLAFRFNDTPVIKTTLNKNIQILLEDRLKLYHKKLLNLGIQNVAGMIIDTKSREVLAYGGSQDFFDIDGFGQIDGIVAKRSPGSVLKPLLYALAIENGIIATLIVRPVINVDLRNGDSFYFRYDGEQIICMIKADSAKTFQEIINAKQGSPFMEKPGGSSSASVLHNFAGINFRIVFSQNENPVSICFNDKGVPAEFRFIKTGFSGKTVDSDDQRYFSFCRLSDNRDRNSQQPGKKML